MRLLDTLHRWLGGLIGLWLVVMGLSGAVLLHRSAWIVAPHAHDIPAQSTEAVAGAVARIMSGPEQPRSIVFATGDFGLHELASGQSGAYTDGTGTVVVRWRSRWERPELWLFDLHHRLLGGEAGETIVGVGGLIGLFFVVSGTILWWRTRATFRFRPLPQRLTRPTILRWHRDIGIVAAPLIALSFATGALLVFRPLSAIPFGPGAPATIAAAVKPPKVAAAKLADDLDWRALVFAARTAFPDAQFGALILPPAKGGLITLRMRRPAEWLPKGRTTLWFAADTGRLIATRDGTRVPVAARAYNMVYPLHAAEVGGLPYRIVMTLSGIALTMLGSLTVWTFWGSRRRRVRRA